MKYRSLFLLPGALALALLVAGCAAKSIANQRNTPPAKPKPAVTATLSAAPTAVNIGPDEASCPVLGTVMKKSQMIPVQHNGKTYYLCCADCVPKFKANPEKYIAHPAAPTRGMAH
jgi:YHS domain-containing protein